MSLTHINRDAHRRFLSIALPMVLAALASPLPGIVDTALLGHLADVQYLSAVAAGSTIIGLVIWSFSFLRMGTTATTARALGSNDMPRCQLLLAQSLVMATVLGIGIVVLQGPLLSLSFKLITPPEQSLTATEVYTRIRIFAAPAILGSFAITGWLIGTQKARMALVVILLVNIINVGLDLLFIMSLEMNSEGAAWASLLAEYTGLLVGLVIVYRLAFRNGGRLLSTHSHIANPNPPANINNTQNKHDQNWLITQLAQLSLYRELFTVNRHLLVRTACLIFIFAFFTAQGAKQGVETLAANAILMQLFFLFSFGLDGFAQATEALTGQAIGGRNDKGFYQTCKLASVWGFGLATATTVVYLYFDAAIIGLFTNITGVLLIAQEHFIWLALVPLTAVGAFLLDGVFLGAGRTKHMQNIMLLAAIMVFMPIWQVTQHLGNQGLWLAFLLFMAARTVLMALAFWQISLRGWSTS